MGSTTRYIKLFVFGIKLAFLLLALVVPLAVWFWALIVFVPGMGEWPRFSRSSVFMVGLYSTEGAAKNAREGGAGRAVYRVDLDDNRMFYVVTSAGINDDETGNLKAALELLSNQHPAVLSALPGMLDAVVPESARKVANRRVNAIGRVSQAVAVIAISMVCFALYFPLAGAAMSLFKTGRLGDTGVSSA